MRFNQIAALALSALLVSAGLGAVAAQSGNAPADGQADNQSDAAEQRGDESAANASETGSDAAMNASENGNGSATAADARGGQGPPTDLPAQVPDFVVQIHVLINDFLSGDLAGPLGPVIADETPDDGNETADNETADNSSEDVESEDADAENGDSDATEDGDSGQTETETETSGDSDA